MTSNVGSQFPARRYIQSGSCPTGAACPVPARVLNRIDDIITFSALTREDLAEIVDIQTENLQRMLAERDIQLHLSDEAKHFLADTGYDPAFGARPLKRTIQRYVADPLALELLEGHFAPGDAIRVTVDEDGLVFEQDIPLVEGEVVA